jgi:hypothetical protein
VKDVAQLRRVAASEVVLCLVALVACRAESTWPPASEAVTGRLSEVDGIPVLHLWGTPREQGHAIGYLLAPEIVGFYDRLIGDRTWDLDPQRWNDEVLPAARRFTIAPEYLEEFEGMLQGIESRAGGPAEVPSLGRDLRIEDLIAACYVYDDRRLGCTSFAAWGSMTADGRTLYGRNMDWPASPTFLETPQIIVVRAPGPGTDRRATISVFFPLIVGVTTAMNADGIVLCNNDAYNERDPVRRSGFYPAPLSTGPRSKPHGPRPPARTSSRHCGPSRAASDVL